MSELPHIIEFQNILYKHMSFQLDKVIARQTPLQKTIESLSKGTICMVDNQ